MTLHADPERRRAMVERSDELCKEYGWAAQGEIYLSAYAELLDDALAPEAAPAVGC